MKVSNALMIISTMMIFSSAFAAPKNLQSGGEKGTKSTSASISIAEIRALTPHKARIKLGSLPLPSSGCANHVYIDHMDGTSAQSGAYFLNPVGGEIADIDGMNADQTYGFTTKLITRCNRSEKISRSQLQLITMPSEDQSSPAIQASTSAGPNGTLINLLSSGTLRVNTSIDGIPCDIYHPVAGVACHLQLLLKNSSGESQSINENDIFGSDAKVVSFVPEENGSVFFSPKFWGNLDRSVPHTYRAEFVDFLGRTSAVEWVIPAQ